MCFIFRVQWGSWDSLALQGAKATLVLAVLQVIQDVKDYRGQRYEGQNALHPQSQSQLLFWCCSSQVQIEWHDWKHCFLSNPFFFLKKGKSSRYGHRGSKGGPGKPVSFFVLILFRLFPFHPCHVYQTGSLKP